MQNCPDIRIFNALFEGIFWRYFLKYSENLLQQNLDFEHVILENALENIVGKFGRHLQIIKPVLERLLEPIEKVEQNKPIAICFF